MIKEIQNVKLHYIVYGNENGIPVVLLHGWGQNIAMMKPVGDAIQKTHRVIIVDLPGHGESSEPSYAWMLHEFVTCLKTLLDELQVTNPIFIGHSFGGKISLLYATMYDVRKLILFASPYQKEVKTMSVKTRVLKQLKKVPGLNKLEDFAKKHIGSTDYRQATPVMRQILVNHVNLDLCEEVGKITCPVLLLWGTEDEAVSYEQGKKLERLLLDAGLVTYEGCSHYAYIERLGQTIQVVHSFLKSEGEL